MKQFQDHFSDVASSYARFRPRYPSELFAWLASIAPSRDLCWDCGTGNGQAAVALAGYFEEVVATDASAEQIEEAAQHERVRYAVAPAEESPLETGAADLVTVAQALHWFDLPRFFDEVRRVLKPGGVVAAWGYGRLVLPDATLQNILDTFYEETVGPFWPPGRTLVEGGYRDVAFPFEEIDPPVFEMTASFTLEMLMGYVGTWSATQLYMRARDENPLPALQSALAAAWGRPESPLLVRWPVGLRAGRV